MAASTHIQHMIKNNTPYDFYYIVTPIDEIPTVFSCNCSGIITPGETQLCDCFSDLQPEYRRYRIEYMKNASPSYREAVSYAIDSDVRILWEFTFNAYWQWILVKPSHSALIEL